MIFKMYAVHDSKSELYNPPACYRARGLALRHFAEIAQNKENEIGKNPADFHIFEIGEYDDSSCEVKMFKTPVNLGCALEYLNGQSPSLIEEPTRIERAN